MRSTTRLHFFDPSLNPIPHFIDNNSSLNVSNTKENGDFTLPEDFAPLLAEEEELIFPNTKDAMSLYHSPFPFNRTKGKW